MGQLQPKSNHAQVNRSCYFHDACLAQLFSALAFPLSTPFLFPFAFPIIPNHANPRKHNSSLSLSHVCVCVCMCDLHLCRDPVGHSCRLACGAPDVDWKTASDSTAPEGWTISGFSSNVGDLRDCANGWNAYATLANQGELTGVMQGAGRATVVYRDCWREGFVGLYVNGEKMDQTEENNGVQKTFRCAGSVLF